MGKPRGAISFLLPLPGGAGSDAPAQEAATGREAARSCHGEGKQNCEPKPGVCQLVGEQGGAARGRGGPL